MKRRKQSSNQRRCLAGDTLANKSIIIQIRVAGNKIIGIPIALLTILIFTFDECSWYVAHSKFFFDFLFEKKTKKYEHKLKL